MTIRQIQCLLAYLGYGPGAIDGADGPQTRAAVIAFQQAEGLEPDGIAGQQTQARLREAVFQDRVYVPDGDSGGGDGKQDCKTGTFWDNIQYFKRSDPYIGCSCGQCGGFPVEPSEKLMRLADKVRGKAGRPMVPTSTVRCKAHNKAVGGKDTSRHMKGKAMDFVIPGMTSAEILAIVRSFPEVVFCYAINERAVHMDVGN